MYLRLLAGAVLASVGMGAAAQSVVTVGKATYASEPPTYKAKNSTAANPNEGFNATKMLTRKIYCDEQPGRPIPTNDWWTDIINNKFSGSLWSYPAMLRTGDYGVQICYPSYWADYGKELKPKSALFVGGVKFTAESTIAADWSDWSVVFRQPNANPSGGEITTTAVHGMPFTWFEFDDVTPLLSTTALNGFPGDVSIFGRDDKSGYMGVKIGNDLYGVYYPAYKSPKLVEGNYRIDGAGWIVVALLTDESDLKGFAKYAASIPRSTRVDWNYNEAQALVSNSWKVAAVNLRNPGAAAPVMQGFLPHAYKYAESMQMQAANSSYQTPRGIMRVYTSDSGDFSYAYRFSGMMPFYATPKEDPDFANGYKQEIMDELMNTYARGGTFGGDTYWGGKGLVQMALNMTFAKETGNTAQYETSKKKLRDSFVDWLTYTPGENNTFFSYYPRWGAMLGFDVSYDSDAFNDHHFHYGYFTYAAALLCMEDKEFAADYGELLTMIAKDYANWDRNDSRFPLMRTLDLWNGHSWAGGLGDAGNDNGNGQESTSEAMQSWGGLYLLGVALDNKDMRDAGIWGWNTEARATREYWYDVDAPRPANEGGRAPWPGKNDRQGNYNYDEYPYAYNSNITGKGIGWWTWFGGDPLYMHGIQWMPISPALDYLSWDTDFVKWAYEDMMSGANSTFSHEWFTPTVNTVNGETIEPLANNDWGNVALSYMQRALPDQAADIFARAWKEGRHIAKSVSTSHISYYILHHHRTYGELDPTVYSDMPTSSVYVKDGKSTYMVYNPGSEDRTVKFYKNGAVVKTVSAPAGRIAAIQADPYAASVTLESSEGTYLPANDKTRLSARVLDQYGAGYTAAAPVSWSVSPAMATVAADGTLTVNGNAANGSKYTVTATSGSLSKSLEFMVGERPVANKKMIAPIPEYLEVGSTLELTYSVTDQYGNTSNPADTKWTVTFNGKTVGTTSRFNPAVAGKYQIKASSWAGDYTEEVFVTPTLPNLALKATATASSEENAGSLASSVNDGDKGTRWGSRHNEDEWIYLDLGENSYITRVNIVWEAAFASDYDIQVAPSGCAMESHKGSYAGGEKTVQVPAASAWTTVAEVRGNSSAGARETLVGARGRYVRMRGITRASAYGYSIYEMSVSGVPGSMSNSDLVGVAIDIPEVMDEGETAVLTATGYTPVGDKRDVEVKWSADKAATFSGNKFTPNAAGRYTVTATTPEGFSSSITTFVNEVPKMTTLIVTPSETQTLISTPVKVVPEAYDQFGGLVPTDASTLSVSSLNQQHLPSGKYDISDFTFVSSSKGIYNLYFKSNISDVSATATVQVLDVSEANLALNKAASASSAKNPAKNANDGDHATRWESDWIDGEWLAVDLDGAFLVNKVVIDWEGAYAKDYRIQTSMNGETWTDVYKAEGRKGGVETLYITEHPAAWVRVVCDKRGSDYGNSIKELEVYGSAFFEIPDDNTPPVVDKLEATVGNGTVDVLASASDESGYVFYRLEVFTPTGNLVDYATGFGVSGTPVGVSLDGLFAGVEYEVKFTATDPFGNFIEAKKDFIGMRDITGENLALNKPASESSYENLTLQGSKAVDGDYSTRWSSKFTDPEWLLVDLLNVYSLREIRVWWDNVAYSTSYYMEYSEDGDHWFNLYARNGWDAAEAPAQGAGRYDSYLVPSTVYARYLRLTGTERSTQYGHSINEFEVYGDNDFTHTVGVGGIESDSLAPVNVYTATGLLVRVGVERAKAVKGLPAGIYIVGNQKVLVK